MSFLATKIRLTRVGSHKRPFYRVVVANSASPRDGRCIERLGTYNPFKETDKLVIDLERTLSWIKKGAIPTSVVRSHLNKLTKQNDNAVN